MLQTAFFRDPQLGAVSAAMFTFCYNVCNEPVRVTLGPEATPDFVGTISLRAAVLTSTLFSQVCGHVPDFGQVSH